ncbi:helix-turn-helix transcriptional regulator [Methanococcoides sp. FTZ1]|uniref:helix-turn-helix transcriptional regulator n=1 Tax=Methanococcoides sp. FTZ1 TaxID=3439061 RepID=UPI003F85A7A9
MIIMQSSLLDTIWLSEKRKKLIQYLKDGPRDIEEIKSFFNFSSRSIVPEIKKLKKQEILIEENGLYRLSNIGKIISKKMEDLLNTEKMIELDTNYWQNADLSSVPPHLYRRIGELNNYTFHEYEMENIFEPPLQFKENLNRTKNIMQLVPYLIPQFPMDCLDLLEKGKKLSLIFPQSVFEMLKIEYPTEMKKLMGSIKIGIFVCDDEKKRPMISVLDNFAYLGFFTRNGTYSSKEIISIDVSAINWTKELFTHYMNTSKSISEF